MKAFELSFIDFSWIDVIDITLVAIFIVLVYRLLKGSIALNIVIGIFAIFLLYLVVNFFGFKLLSLLLAQFIKVGVLVLVILFQPEIRKFLLVIGRKFTAEQKSLLQRLFPKLLPKVPTDFRYLQEIVIACQMLAKSKIGALIVIRREADLDLYANTGNALQARVSARLLEAIFQKSSPLHDGAVIIEDQRIKAAGCVLPISENLSLPDELGLRHRSAIGVTEHADALVIVVSEETGKIALASNASLTPDIAQDKLLDKLKREMQNL